MRNLLTLAIGILFQQERRRIRLNSKEFSERIGVGESTLRLFEVGRTLLPIEVIPQVCEVIRHFKFDRLSKLFAILHYSKGKNWDSILLIITRDKLIKDPEIISLFNLFKRSELDIDLSSKNLDKLQTTLEEYGVIRIVENYLTAKFFVSTEQDETIVHSDLIRLVSTMPSYDYDDVLEYLQRRVRKPLQISTDTIKIWEDQRRDDIDEIYGVIVDHSAITEFENVHTFDYSYLWKGVTMKVIFLDMDVSFDHNAVKTLFFDNLLKSLKIKASPFYKSVEYMDKKIWSSAAFKNGIQVHTKLNENVLSFIWNNEKTYFKNFWGYKLKDNRIVSFLSNDQFSKLNFLGISPTLIESKNRVDAFRKLWTQLK